MLTVVFVALIAVCSAAPTKFDFKAVATQYFLDHPTVASYMYVDGDDCTKYYVAIKGHPLPIALQCAAGLHFNELISVCVHGPCPKKELIESCKTNAIVGDSDDCSAYHICAWGEPGIKQCCAPGTAFSEKAQHCVTSTTCTKSCVHTEDKEEPEKKEPQPAPTSCTNGNYKYEKVANDDNKFKQTNIVDDTEPVAILPCPVNYSFNLTECGCVNNDDTVIVPDDKHRCVMLDFENDFDAYKFSVGALNYKREKGEVCFQGDGFLTVYPLANVAYKKFEVSFKYTNNAGDCVLLTNGDGNKIKSSFEVAVVGEKIKVTLVTNDGTFTVERKSADAIVKISYDGADLILKIGDAEEKIVATGEMLLVNYPVIVGKGFTGCLDDLSFCPIHQ